jgi:cytochrome c oxidase accessory protein FixG
MVFRKLEYFFDGDAAEQRALEAEPWTARKIGKRLAKHAVFLALSFLIGNTLLSYIIGSDRLLVIVSDNPRDHLQGLAAMVIFTLVFYAIFARFREQACTFICPYGRFQSALLDENTLVVAYDHKRGEQRGKLHREVTPDERRQGGYGDCVDCHQCVAVCPTGVDIRNGTQMECVNCTACIDACDAVMLKLGLPRGLVRYASLNSIERREPFRFTPRLAGYTVVLTALAGLLALLVFTRSSIDTTLLRAPGALYQVTEKGDLENIYTLKLVNKTSSDVPVRLKLENSEGELTVMGGRELIVPKEQLAETSVLIELPPRAMTGSTKQLRIGVYSGDKRIATVNTSFVGPREGDK